MIFLKFIIGEFYKPLKESVQPGEKAKPIRQSDNLHPEGEFYQRPDQGAPLRGDRADVKKPIDNLRPEGIVQNLDDGVKTFVKS